MRSGVNSADFRSARKLAGSVAASLLPFEVATRVETSEVNPAGCRVAEGAGCGGTTDWPLIDRVPIPGMSSASSERPSASTLRKLDGSEAPDSEPVEASLAATLSDQWGASDARAV